MNRYFILLGAVATSITSTATAELSGQAAMQSGSLFNPEISVILDTVYANDVSSHPADPTGFTGGHSHGHGHGHGHDHSHGVEEGFQVREIELAISGSVDPYFDLDVLLGITDSSLEIEEAYFTTRSLPAGLQVRGGRFLSDVGYINRKHIHDWHFVDRPWVNEFLFGDEGLNEVGVQVSWMPATHSYTRVGIEILEGENPGIAPFDGGTHDEHDVTVKLDDTSSPRLVTLFGKWGPDLGDDHALQLGLSGGYSNTYQRVEEHSSREDIWDGDAWFAGIDAVYKHDAGRSHGHGNWVLQAEYFYREIDFDWIATDGSAEDSGKDKQDGIYAQAVYGFAPRWNAGLRVDALGLTNTAFDPGRDADGERVRDFVDFGTSYRYSAQVSYLPTEFSRFRLQVNQETYGDNPNRNDEPDDSLRVMLQANFALGAHGAHTF